MQTYSHKEYKPDDPVALGYAPTCREQSAGQHSIALLLSVLVCAPLWLVSSASRLRLRSPWADHVARFDS
eukprot:2168979-Amphidinium_carterae.1